MSRSKTIKLKKFQPHFFLIKVFNLEHREWCFFCFCTKILDSDLCAPPFLLLSLQDLKFQRTHSKLILDMSNPLEGSAYIYYYFLLVICYTAPKINYLFFSTKIFQQYIKVQVSNPCHGKIDFLQSINEHFFGG